MPEPRLWPPQVGVGTPSVFALRKDGPVVVSPYGSYWWKPSALIALLGHIKKADSKFQRYRLLFRDHLGIDWEKGRHRRPRTTKPDAQRSHPLNRHYEFQCEER